MNTLSPEVNQKAPTINSVARQVAKVVESGGNSNEALEQVDGMDPGLSPRELLKLKVVVLGTAANLLLKKKETASQSKIDEGKIIQDFGLAITHLSPDIPLDESRNLIKIGMEKVGVEFYKKLNESMEKNRIAANRVHRS